MAVTYTILGPDGKHYGPVTLEQFQDWQREGRINGETQVLRSDLNTWYPASSYSELGGSATAAPGHVAAGAASAPTAFAGVVPAELANLERQIKGGGSWFHWIAGLSLINSIMALVGGGFGFVIGLTATQFIDAFAAEAGGGARAVAFAVGLVAAGLFVLFGVFAMKRHLWAFVVGTVLYALDTLLTLPLLASGEGFVWLTVGFHAWALFSLVVGLSATVKFRKLSTNLA